MTIIWTKIEAVMKEKQVTPYGLAQLMGVQITSIYRLKNGEIKSPGYKRICQIADALEVPTEIFRIEETDIQRKESRHVGKNRKYSE